jgi:hypothetical protein
MESGEYFLRGWEKKAREKKGKEMARIEKKMEQQEERMKDFIPPREDVPKKKKRKTEDGEGEKRKKRNSDDTTEEVPSTKVTSKSGNMKEGKRRGRDELSSGINIRHIDFGVLPTAHDPEEVLNLVVYRLIQSKCQCQREEVSGC